jgi:hypothetical protein
MHNGINGWSREVPFAAMWPVRVVDEKEIASADASGMSCAAVVFRVVGAAAAAEGAVTTGAAAIPPVADV